MILENFKGLCWATCYATSRKHGGGLPRPRGEGFCYKEIHELDAYAPRVWKEDDDDCDTGNETNDQEQKHGHMFYRVVIWQRNMRSNTLYTCIHKVTHHGRMYS